MRKIPGDVEVLDEEDWYRAPLNVSIRGVDVPVFAASHSLVSPSPAPDTMISFPGCASIRSATSR